MHNEHNKNKNTSLLDQSLNSSTPDISLLPRHHSTRHVFLSSSNIIVDAEQADKNGNAEEDGDYDSKPTISTSTSSSASLVTLAYISLFLAIFSMSCVGPVFLYLLQHGLSPILCACWRNQIITLAFIPCVIIEWKYRKPEEKRWSYYYVPLNNGKSRFHVRITSHCYLY